MASSVSLSQAKGSTLLNFAVYDATSGGRRRGILSRKTGKGANLRQGRSCSREQTAGRRARMERRAESGEAV